MTKHTKTDDREHKRRSSGSVLIYLVSCFNSAMTSIGTASGKSPITYTISVIAMAASLATAISGNAVFPDALILFLCGFIMVAIAHYEKDERWFYLVATDGAGRCLSAKFPSDEDRQHFKELLPDDNYIDCGPVTYFWMKHSCPKIAMLSFWD